MVDAAFDSQTKSAGLDFSSPNSSLAVATLSTVLAPLASNSNLLIATISVFLTGFDLNLANISAAAGLTMHEKQRAQQRSPGHPIGAVTNLASGPLQSAQVFGIEEMRARESLVAAIADAVCLLAPKRRPTLVW